MTTWLAAAALLTQAVQAPAGGVQTAEPAAVETEMQVAVVADVLPRRDGIELRPRFGVAITVAPAERITARFDGRLDALTGDRDGRVDALVAEAREAWVDIAGERAELRGGFGRLVWGRLDEIAPTDVINPLDTARFLFEGRSEARLPVAFVRGRLTPSDRVRIEVAFVPLFRRGLFDRLDEQTSPFNLVRDAVAQASTQVVVTRREPLRSWRNVAGGGRVDVTAGRADIGVSAFRGFEGLGPVALEPPGDLLAPDPPTLVLHHPRFTMLGADFETVMGPWAWRGEAAVFVERWLARSSGVGLVKGRSLDAGMGVDRRAGDFRVFGSAILHRAWSADDRGVSRTDVSVVGSIERAFGRERYFARVFGVANPADRSAFLRGIFSWKRSDRVAVEGSAGVFTGTSDDAIGRFRTRDFFLVTLRIWLL
jgi:hypothetical protein